MRALLSNKEQSGEKDRQVGAAALESWVYFGFSA